MKNEVFKATTKKVHSFCHNKKYKKSARILDHVNHQISLKCAMSGFFFFFKTAKTQLQLRFFCEYFPP